MRIKKIQAKLKKLNLDAVLFTDLVNIRYLCGYSGSNGILFIGRNSTLFLTDFRYKEQIETEVVGVDKLVPKEGILISALGVNPVIEPVKKLGFERSIEFGRLEKYKEQLPKGIEWAPVDNFVAEMRWVKTEEEIRKIRVAISIAENALLESLPILKPGISEKRFAAELEYNMRKAGSERPAFDTIVVSGERGAVIHGIASEKIIESGDFVTIDFGAHIDGYNSDITRTFIMGEPTDKQREVYGLVYLAQTSTIEGVKAGMLGKEIDRIARTIIENAGYGAYFGHGLGHGLGMEVHDNLGVGSRTESVIPSGAVITVEPGIYIPGFGGVRIEDDVRVKDNCCELLTGLPKKIEDMII